MDEHFFCVGHRAEFQKANPGLVPGWSEAPDGLKCEVGDCEAPADAWAEIHRRRGMKHTPETRAKIAAAMRGKKLSPEHRAKIIAALKKSWAERVAK